MVRMLRAPHGATSGDLVTIRAALGNWLTLAGAALVAAGMVWIMAATVTPLTLGDLISLQFAWDGAAVSEQLRQWVFDARLDRFLLHLGPDALLAIAVGVTLASILAIALRRSRRGSRFDLLLLVPLAATVLDLVENLLQLWLIGGVVPIEAMPLVASVSLAKWIAIAASVLIAAVVAIAPRGTGSGKGPGPSPSPGAAV